jgi:serine/threonine protein kinase
MEPNTNSEKTSLIGRYRLGRVLGEGASGIVYRAYDPLMDRTVAIKSVRAEKLDAVGVQEAIDEFHHEARIAGKYAHENIVAIYDIVSTGVLDHIVMEYVAGRSLTEYLESIGPMPIENVLSIVYKCAVGLAYIHYHGVIHRDIKLGNILYHHAGDLVKIMDFSIAHPIDQLGARENGTRPYMAPEHFDPWRKITPMTDLFALGTTMYRMLVDQYPFGQDNTVDQILHAHQIPVTELRPEIPQEVSDLVEKALAKADEDRFQSAAEFALAAERVMHICYPDSRIASQADTYMSV